MSVLPFVAGGAHSLLKSSDPRPLRPTHRDRQVILRTFIDDIQLLLLERYRIFQTIATLAHGLAEKERARLRERTKRQPAQPQEQQS